ncbi:MAG: hypothetical protein LUG13_04030 [Oscillospiraceae bacterium]|nr:hypothetical protein [Oscillospiraceae bacterium]
MDCQAEREGFTIRAEATWMGSDLLVLVTGGAAHIGSVSMATPRPSLADAADTSATVSTFCFPSHKDHFVGNQIAEALSARFGKKVVVVCGVHYDNLSGDNIALILSLVEELLEKICKQLVPE